MIVRTKKFYFDSARLLLPFISSCRFCAVKTHQSELKQKEEPDDFMPSVDLDDLSPKQLRNVQLNTSYQREFGEINLRKKRSPAPGPDDVTAKRRNFILGGLIFSLVIGTYWYTVNQIAREGYLDEKLESSDNK